MSKFDTIFLRRGQTVLLHAALDKPERIVVNCAGAAIRIGFSSVRVAGGNAALQGEDIANPSIVLGPRNLLYVGLPEGPGLPVLVTMQVFDLEEFGYDLHS